MSTADPKQVDFRPIAERIWSSAVASQFRGSDPYDGLKSSLLGPIVRRSRLLSLITIQAVKHSPLNLRPWLRIPAGVNPKGLALFLQGISELPDLSDSEGQKTWIEDSLLSLASLPTGEPAFGLRDHQPGLAAQVADGRTPIPEAIGWGYDFPWQGRAFLQPAYFPTVVATCFVVDALAAVRSRCSGLVSGAAARFVSGYLHRYEDEDGVCFSYSPRDRTRVYNASLFAAKILARGAREGRRSAAISAQTADEWEKLAARAADFVMKRQRKDGAWLYGEASHWRWVDNLHTGFMLETFAALAVLLEDDRWAPSLQRGLAYYRNHLFHEDGTARYKDTELYPLDPHAFAQGVLTFLALRDRYTGALNFARAILTRGTVELWDDRRGGYRFQKQRFYTNSTIHLRWSQAWMFRALCTYLTAAERSL